MGIGMGIRHVDRSLVLRRVTKNRGLSVEISTKTPGRLFKIVKKIEKF